MMQWDEVMESVVIPLLELDTELVGPTGLNGAHIYAGSSSRPVRIPSVEWILLDDVETEVFNPIRAQFDIYGEMSVIRVVEQRIRTRLTWNTRRIIAGVNMSSLYEDSITLAYPAQPGIVHRALRFQFEPVRRRAVTES